MKRILKQIVLESNKKQLFCGVKRSLFDKILPNIERPEIISLSGVRRCGKTVLFNQIITSIDRRENCLIVNFEDERFIDFKVEHFDLLLEIFFENNLPNGKIFLFFDEIQEVKNWEKWVRRIYDSNKEIKIFITGSSSSLLSSEFSTLLTGRNISFVLYPLSFVEYLKFQDFSEIEVDLLKVDIKLRAKIKFHLNNFILNGGFPSVSVDYSLEVLQQYFRDIIYRDIVKRYQVRDVRQLEEIFQYLLTNVSNLYSYNNIKNTFKAGIDTVKEYINYAISANLLFDQLYYSYSLKESFNRPRKTYCIDNGLRNAVSFKFSADIGRLVENQVYLELKRTYGESYYFKGKHEVDFIVKDKDQKLIAINVSYTNTLEDREFLGLLEIKKEFQGAIKRTLIISDDIEDTIQGVEVIPLWQWLIESHINKEARHKSGVYIS